MKLSTTGGDRTGTSACRPAPAASSCPRDIEPRPRHFRGKWRLPVLDAFTELLLAGRADFAWSADTAAIRYDTLEDEAYRAVERGLTVHVGRVQRDVDERAAATA